MAMNLGAVLRISYYHCLERLTRGQGRATGIRRRRRRLRLNRLERIQSGSVQLQLLCSFLLWWSWLWWLLSLSLMLTFFR